MVKPVKLYLFAYNALQGIGWIVSLFTILGSVLLTKSISGAYASSENLIAVLQVGSFFEILHGATGIVPSGAMSPLLQWLGRNHFLVAVVRQIPEVQELPLVFTTLVAWCISDVIRYPHYALNCIGTSPSWLTYLRYTAFIGTYLVGVVGEMWIIYQALPFVKKVNLYGDLFASLPFTYYGFLKALLVVYPFLWLKLYLHLWNQRQSKFGGERTKKKNK